MENYVRRLILEIDEAILWVNIQIEDQIDSIDEFTEIERIISEIPEKTLGDQIGFRREKFPLATSLTERQLIELIDAVKELYGSCGVIVDLPESLPPVDYYKFLMDALDIKIILSSRGFIHIEYCEYIPEECPFGSEFCHCRNDDFFGQELIVDSDFNGLGEPISSELLLEHVKSRYTLQMIEDITSTYESFLNPEEVLMLFEFEEEDLEEGLLMLGKKSIAEWIGFDLSLYPVPEKIFKDDADAIVVFLFDPWDDEDDLINAILGMQDSIERYRQTLTFFNQQVRFDGESGFFLDPLTTEELDAMIKHLPELLDDSLFDGIFDEEEGED